MGILALGAGVAALLACLEWATAAAPPLSIEDLLHEEIPKAEKRAETPQVDNGACYVCHGNYDGEPLVLAHAERLAASTAGPRTTTATTRTTSRRPISCTAPTRSPRCAKCHETHDAPAQGDCTMARARPFEDRSDKLVCTDCRGTVKFRTVWWNKKTREVFVRKTHQEAEAAGGPAASSGRDALAHNPRLAAMSAPAGRSGCSGAAERPAGKCRGAGCRQRIPNAQHRGELPGGGAYQRRIGRTPGDVQPSHRATSAVRSRSARPTLSLSDGSRLPLRQHSRCRLGVARLCRGNPCCSRRSHRGGRP